AAVALTTAMASPWMPRGTPMSRVTLVQPIFRPPQERSRVRCQPRVRAQRGMRERPQYGPIVLKRWLGPTECRSSPPLTNRLFVGRASGASIKVPRLWLGLQFRARHMRLLLLSPDSELISGANRPAVG